MSEEDAVQGQRISSRSSFPTASQWPKGARDFVVRRGITLVCGSPDFVPTSAASNVSVISGGLRLLWLRVLMGVELQHFIAKSGLGYDFVCHIGDLSEYPFYHPRAYEKELALCLGWLRHEVAPIVYDVGANVGFISTHLAQMLSKQAPKIYAFEPVPTTFSKLKVSVSRLGVHDVVCPVQLALGDTPGTLQIAFFRRNSLVSRVVTDHAVAQIQGEQIVYARGTTLDEFSAEMGVQPTLIKMDIEGSEVAALRGARNLLSREDRPSILFEHNPVALGQRGMNPKCFTQLLSGYQFHYVDDLQDQMLPFGSRISDLSRVNWICNLFAVPTGEESAAKWHSAVTFAWNKLGIDGSAA
jgi:FkbM family methyltransferase